MKRFIGRAGIGLLLTAVAGCAGADPLSPQLDQAPGSGAAAIVPADPDGSTGRPPDSITVVQGEGATLNDGGRTDGRPPPEVTIEKQDGTIIRPGQ